MNIDLHAHFVPQALLDDLVAQRHGFSSVKTTAESAMITGGTAQTVFNIRN